MASVVVSVVVVAVFQGPGRVGRWVFRVGCGEGWVEEAEGRGLEFWGELLEWGVVRGSVLDW